MRAFLAAVIALACIVTGCTGKPTASTGRVSVLASWTGQEGKAFQRVLSAFTARTGIAVDYQGTRAAGPVLNSELQQGNPPDIAILPNPGALATYVHSGDLHPLDDVIADPAGSFSPQWLRLQRLGSIRHLYAIAVKADLKSIIWYDPARLTGPLPSTWPDLEALQTRISNRHEAVWCLGLHDPPGSGWPGTDWIEDILLHRSGTAAYDRWASGRLPWTSPQVRKAWATWGGTFRSLHGGWTAALLTGFADAGRGLFTRPQGCAMEHEGSFIMVNYRGYPQHPRPGRDFDFFPFPRFAGTTGAAEVSADLAGMFTGTAQAKRLMQFLASSEGQQVWPKMTGYGAFSANKNVRGDAVYTDPVSRRIARILTSDAPLCFDAADLMPAGMSSAFSRAVLEYVDDPSRLDTLLVKLDRVRRSLEASDWLNAACG